jgi:hypothetical protein
MGLSYEDFCRCTPSEFKSIHDCWQEQRQQHYRDGWEQVRTLVSCFLPFYPTKKTIREVMPFPWDSKTENAVPKGGSSPEAFRRIMERKKVK